MNEISAPWTAQGDVKISAGRIHWSSVGIGYPVVLLPKLGGWVADWRHEAPLFAQELYVVRTFGTDGGVI